MFGKLSKPDPLREVVEAQTSQTAQALEGLRSVVERHGEAAMRAVGVSQAPKLPRKLMAH